jgi:hypothetical protein
MQKRRLVWLALACDLQSQWQVVPGVVMKKLFVLVLVLVVVVLACCDLLPLPGTGLGMGKNG